MTEQQQLARGKNQMLALLERRLSVPRIYFDANWQGNRVDILAIDRDGSGDVHVVLAYIRPLHELSLPDTMADKVELDRLIERFAGISAQYKYILGVASNENWRPFAAHPAEEYGDKTFSPDGLGRVGLAFASPDLEGGMAVNLAIFPERFRAHVGAVADDFVKKNLADWEVRA